MGKNKNEEMTLQQAEVHMLTLVDDVAFEMLPLPMWFLEKYKGTHEKINKMYEERKEQDRIYKKYQELEANKNKINDDSIEDEPRESNP